MNRGNEFLQGLNELRLVPFYDLALPKNEAFARLNAYTAQQYHNNCLWTLDMLPESTEFAAIRHDIERQILLPPESFIQPGGMTLIDDDLDYPYGIHKGSFKEIISDYVKSYFSGIPVSAPELRLNHIHGFGALFDLSRLLDPKIANHQAMNQIIMEALRDNSGIAGLNSFIIGSYLRDITELKPGANFNFPFDLFADRSGALVFLDDYRKSKPDLHEYLHVQGGFATRAENPIVRRNSDINHGGTIFLN